MKETILNAFRQSDSEVKQNIRDAVNMAHDYTEETQMLLAKIQDEKDREKHVLHFLHEMYDTGESAWFIEIDLDADNVNAFVANNLLYFKKVLESKGTEVRYEKLDQNQRPLFDEAMAREVS
jgi:hypothetical protein